MSYTHEIIHVPLITVRLSGNREASWTLEPVRVFRCIACFLPVRYFSGDWILYAVRLVIPTVSNYNPFATIRFWIVQMLVIQSLVVQTYRACSCDCRVVFVRKVHCGVLIDLLTICYGLTVSSPKERSHACIYLSISERSFLAHYDASMSFSEMQFCCGCCLRHILGIFQSLAKIPVVYRLLDSHHLSHISGGCTSKPNYFCIILDITLLILQGTSFESCVILII